MAFDPSFFSVDETNLSSRITQAKHYLEQYEGEVKRAQGASGYFFPSKEDALGRIKVLVEFAPDNEEIKNLYARAKACVKGGYGSINTVDDSYTQYLVNEENLRKHYAEISEKAWNELIEEKKADMLEKPFPTPDYREVDIEDMMGKIVVLDEVMYPDNQFMGLTGEFVHTGKRSSGMYFVKIDGKQWLGPYEAIKRYRRNIDTTMNEVSKWSVIGKIVDFVGEIPEAGEKKVGSLVMSWVVEPIALYVPGHTMAICKNYNDFTGKFIGEEDMEALKEAWYTVKSVPDDVTPERLVEIYMSAIKEKNYELYKSCISLDRQEKPIQQDMLMYHWELHQERFHGEYIHANILSDRTKISVISGFDESSDDNFFLDEAEIAKLKESMGEKVQEAVVYTSSFDKNGKQLGTPAGHTLIKKGNGRWFITTYEVRF